MHRIHFILEANTFLFYSTGATKLAHYPSQPLISGLDKIPRLKEANAYLKAKTGQELIELSVQNDYHKIIEHIITQPDIQISDDMIRLVLKRGSPNMIKILLRHQIPQKQKELKQAMVEKKKMEEECQLDIELTDKKIQDLETEKKQVNDEQETLKKELESLSNEDTEVKELNDKVNKLQSMIVETIGELNALKQQRQGILSPGPSNQRQIKENQ